MNCVLAGVAQLVRPSSHKVKGCWFNSWTGHMPELQVGSLVGVHAMFLSHTDVSLPLFLPPFPSLNKGKKERGRKEEGREEGRKEGREGGKKEM